MSVLLTLLGLAVLAWIDVPPLVAQRAWRDLAVYGAIWTAGAVLALLIAFNVPMPVIGSYIAMATHGFLALVSGGR